MVLKKHDSRLVDRYLDGDLYGPELENFKKELESDSGLRAEVKLQREINEAIGERDVIDLREKLKFIHESSEARKSRSSIRRVLTGIPSQIAASAAIFLLIAVFAIRQTGDVSVAERLFDKYYEKYEPLNIRSGAEEIDQTYQKAVVAYRNQDYEVALMYFEEVLQLDQNKMEANMLSGASEMEMQRFRKAQKSFSKVIDHNDNLFIEDAEWFLGFCYLKTNNNEKAVTQFSKIAEGNSGKKETAKRILKKIK